MKKLFEYIFYNLSLLYTKHERDLSGPWAIIGLIQAILILIFIVTPVAYTLTQDERTQIFTSFRPYFIGILVALAIGNYFMFTKRYEKIANKFKDEPMEISNRNRYFIFGGIILIFAILVLLINNS